MVEKQEENENTLIEGEIETNLTDTHGATETGSTVAEEILEEVAQLREQVVELTAQSKEYLDGWQRARADFANYKKRIEREQAETYRMAAASVLKRFLEVLDDLDLALANKPEQGGAEDFSNGIELIRQKLLLIMENEGITKMDVDGMEFDPNLHEAISSEDSPDHDSGEIIAVVKNGYMVGDKVLRPAVVRVAK
jgi:molecular chaperone GrpE